MESKPINNNDRYFAQLDPKTGSRYVIPLLHPKDHQYFIKYVRFMKIREETPDEFEKMMIKPNDSDRLFAQINPKTGFRYDIPMLSCKDKRYFQRYVQYMKIRESKPEDFEKILNWE